MNLRLLCLFLIREILQIFSSVYILESVCAENGFCMGLCAALWKTTESNYFLMHRNFIKMSSAYRKHIYVKSCPATGEPSLGKQADVR